MRLVALDLLRFFAALAVVLYHYTARTELNTFPILAEITKFGYLGVPLFFIISGYVITLSAYNRSAYEFAVSRFIRLYPAFWASILITCIITIVFANKHYSATQILANVTMLNDYLKIDNIDGVYWTLQAELKFYGCIFLLLVFGVFQHIKYWLSAWLAITALYLYAQQPFFMSWFISPHYSPLFIAGVAFYLIHKNGTKPFSLLIMTTSLILACYNGFQQALSFIKGASTLDQYIAAFIIACFYLLFYYLVTGRIQAKKNKSYILLGALTYPLYLIHNAAGKAVIDYYKTSHPEWMLVITTIGAALATSYLIHAKIEKKIAPVLKKSLLGKIKKQSKPKKA